MAIIEEKEFIKNIMQYSVLNPIGIKIGADDTPE